MKRQRTRNGRGLRQSNCASPPQKVIAAAAVARENRIEWLWADTICIDKTSSAELTEAINSMFEWYSHAKVCYAYLSDVGRQSAARCADADSTFRHSRWFTRGWTLQELLAPSRVLFFADNWEYIDEKRALAQVIEEITGIRKHFLTYYSPSMGASVAQKLSWVSNRITSRPEDIAYCMLGILELNMPLLYGEGFRAFTRLQEELIKQSDDHTLFAWTMIPELHPGFWESDGADKEQLPSWDLGAFKSSVGKRPQHFPYRRLQHMLSRPFDKAYKYGSMLATDPVNFYDSSSYVKHLGSSLGWITRPYSLTNTALSIQLPVAGSLFSAHFALAVLQCRSQDHRGRSVAIPLHRVELDANVYVRTYCAPGPVAVGDCEVANLRTLYNPRDPSLVVLPRHLSMSELRNGFLVAYPCESSGFRLRSVEQSPRGSEPFSKDPRETHEFVSFGDVPRRGFCSAVLTFYSAGSGRTVTVFLGFLLRELGEAVWYCGVADDPALLAHLPRTNLRGDHGDAGAGAGIGGGAQGGMRQLSGSERQALEALRVRVDDGHIEAPAVPPTDSPGARVTFGSYIVDPEDHASKGNRTAIVVQLWIREKDPEGEADS